MIRVTWTVPDAARPPSFGLDMLLAELSKPERMFATRRDAEAFIASELRKYNRSGRNAEQGYWWGDDYQSRRGVRVRFEMHDEPGSSAMFESASQPLAPI